MRARAIARAVRSLPVQSQGTAQTRLVAFVPSTGFSQEPRVQFFFFRDALDGLPSGSAAQRAISCAMTASIGAPREVAQAVVPCGNGGECGKEKYPQMNTDTTLMKD